MVFNFNIRFLRLILTIVCTAIFSSAAVAGDSLSVSIQQDSSVYKAVDAKLQEYFSALAEESVDVKSAECDFIIGSAADSLLRNHIAVKSYYHYLGSTLMGDEAVAIHIFDTWFEKGLTAFSGQEEYLNAKIYAEFNRNSLIGCMAPTLVAEDYEGRVREVLDKASGRYSVLYFYDSDCAKCQIQSILLRNLLNEKDLPIDFIPFFTGTDAEKWEEYRSGYLDFKCNRMTVTHLWDPEVNSDFHRKYGVLQTPRLFLMAPDGKIIGRSLNAGVLENMLEYAFSQRDLNYGSEEAEMMFDSVFSDLSQKELKDRIVALSEHVSATTLPSGDTLVFRQMIGDILYYLVPKRGEAYKEGLDYLIDEHILGRPDVWKSKDDSLKVVSMAQLMGDLLSKSRPGTRVSDIRLKLEKVTSRGTSVVSRRLSRLGSKSNMIFFYTEGCKVCAAEKEAALKSGHKIYMINVDEVLADSPNLAFSLFDSFDLSALPYIVETDRKGRVVRRYISFLTE